MHESAHRSNLSGPQADILALQHTAGNRATQQALLAGRKWGGVDHLTEKDLPPFSVQKEEVTAALGPGKSVPEPLQRVLERCFGSEVAGIEAHDDAIADHVARSLNAEALAVGKHIVFRRGNFQPGTSYGRALIYHEVSHVATGSQPGGSNSVQPVQLAVSPSDISEEMIGLRFTLRRVHGSPPEQIPEGGEVEVLAWGAGSTATVRYATQGRDIQADVPKLLLVPSSPSASGVRRYDLSLGRQQRAVEWSQGKVARGQEQIAAWQKREGEFKKNRKSWEEQLLNLEAEQVRLEADLQAREAYLDQLVIRQTMANRFDTIIDHWVKYYNTELKPATNLDQNIVKSVLFEESRMGTFGEHLMLPGQSGFNPVKSRFNVGQAIDSAGPQQLLMMKEMAPDIFARYELDKLELANRRKGMTNREFDDWNGGTFGRDLYEFFHRRGPGGENLMGSTGRDLTDDYSFWIRTTVCWLFYKYLSLENPSWPEAVRAYNGSGPRAKQYRQRVMSRVDSKSPLVISD